MKRIILWCKFQVLTKKRDIEESRVRKYFKQIIFLKVEIFKSLSFLFYIMRCVINITFPVKDFLDAIKGKFSEMAKSVTEKLYFALRTDLLLKYFFF